MLAAVPAAAVLAVVPVPHLFVVAPAAAGGFECLFVGTGVAADPEPGAAQLDFQTVQLQQSFDDGSKLFRVLGRARR